MKKILAVCDKEESYLRRISEYLSHNNMQSFVIMTFTSLNAMNEYIKEKDAQIEIILLSESLYEDDIESLPASKLILLKEDGHVQNDDLVIVNKYQSIVNLMQEVMEAYVQDDTCKGIFTGGNSKTKLVCVYTPGSSDAVQVTAFTLAQVLSQNKKVLYIQLSNFPILKEWLGGTGTNEYDLMDLMLYHNS